jgi:anti-sigma factor ChrR (cupin superfamily)
MLVNHDLSLRALVTADEYEWVSSPQSGVHRVMLDRIGAEQARATSIVRYDAGSDFPAHSHPDGEEILVLEGVFSEGVQHYPAGWYLRNPPGSSHQPSSKTGATIFVKLRQMAAEDTQRVRINTLEASRWQQQLGREICPLYQSAHELVRLESLAAGEPIFTSELVAGAELLVLGGEITEGAGNYSTGSWLRLPAGTLTELVSGKAGALLYIKTGHLVGQKTSAVTQ